MVSAKQPPGYKERQKALRVIQETSLFVVQKSDDNLTWTTVDSIVGKSFAYECMRNHQRDEPYDERVRWRVIPKNEADRVAEGIAIGKKIVSRLRLPHRSVSANV